MAAPSARTLLLTAAALVGFAANSLLCRAALGAGAIDAASFTSLRIGAGAAVLWALVALRGRRRASPALEARSGWLRGSWAGAAALFAYAIAFSLAYLRLEAGLGALLLFGTVQVTMMGVGLRAGERPSLWQWGGLGAALLGLVVLVTPALDSPDPLGALCMVAAGAAWGAYSLLGRSARDPLASTAGSFARAVPLAGAASALALLWTGLSGAVPSGRGVGLALVSGGLASGLGYCLWYAALPQLSRTQAAIAQLCAPLLAAAGGVALLGESLTARLGIGAAAIAGGVAAGVLGAGRPVSAHPAALAPEACAAPAAPARRRIGERGAARPSRW